ncbi:MAG TPA: acyl carrier protein [Pseudonocardiaceae bacterium]|jgi:acyl carrier protein|nr:acyl carrier protein [Pseudonocardiaceae bacterium]
MDTTPAERATKIKEVTCKVLEVEATQLDEDTRFKEDLDADSMKLIELLASLEIEYDVEIDESALEQMVNLRGVYQVLDEALAG